MRSEVEVGWTGRHRASPWRQRPAALLAACAVAAWMLVSAVAPAAAQPGEPPGWWLAESPGTSGARFGLGVDYLFDDLDSLLNAASTQTVTLIDPQGGRSTQVIPGDPGLNNRKSDYEVEVESWGIQAPIALPRLRFGRRMTLFPSLVAEVTTTEVTFDFRDRTVAGDSTSISGRGVSWGLGLEGVAAFGRGGEWFVVGGYRFRSLPDIDLERTPALGDLGTGGQPGHLLTFVRDEVAFSQDTHLVSLRLGCAFAGGRVNPWVGVRGRWTDVEVDDELSFVSVLDDLDGDGTPDLRTDLLTQSRFESDSALAVAGVDARLGESLVGRAEVGYGDGDVGALLKVVYLVPKPPGSPPWTPRKVAQTIAAEFERILREFTRQAERLDPLRASEPALYLSRALELVDRTEQDAVEVLEGEGYIALADWLRDRGTEARAGLRAGAPATSAASRSPRATVALAALRTVARPPQSGSGSEDWLAAFGRTLRWIFVRAEEECLDIYVRFTVEGDSVESASMTAWLRGDPGRTFGIPRGTSEEIARPLGIGSYSYRLKYKLKDQVEIEAKCPVGAADDDEGLTDCPLDLATRRVNAILCQLTPDVRLCFPTKASGDPCGGPPP